MFLPGLATVWADLKKIFAFAPVVAAIDPQAAGGIATAAAVVQALQPVVQAVQDANGGTLSHADLVAKVTDAVAQSSTELAKAGMLSTATDQHVQTVAPLIHAAVTVSGLAATPVQGA